MGLRSWRPWANASTTPADTANAPGARSASETVIPGLDVERAKAYSRARLRLLLGGTVYGLAQQSAFAFSGGSSRLRQRIERSVPDPRLVTPAYLLATGAMSWVADLPLAYYGGYRTERAFGLTKQPPRAWLVERLKALGLGLGLQTVAVAGAYAVIRRRPDDWWLVLSGLTVPVAVLGSTLAPVLIAPLFNRFEPLTDTGLADRVRSIGDRAGVHIADVFQMDMSRQSEKANAFFTGMGRTKRIVLGDTLLREFTPEEIEGVVAHELGHQVHGDIWKLVGIGTAGMTGLSFALAKITPRLIAGTARRTGVSRVGDVASLPLLSLVLSGLGFGLAPAQAAFSRAIERRTDRYALELTGDGASYAGAMARLASQNLADPGPSRFVVWLLYSHPPVSERIAAAERFAATRRASVSRAS